MFQLMPAYFFLVAGDAEGYTPLNAFDNALLRAGVGNTNLVKVSSIIPPGCKEIQPVDLPRGAFVPIAYASIVSDIPGEVISAAVAAGIPDDPTLPGVIMEYSSKGRRDLAEDIARRMVEKAFESRGQKLKEIKSVSAEHVVEKIGASFAGVVLWS